jgi:hypothetical protein
MAGGFFPGNEEKKGNLKNQIFPVRKFNRLLMRAAACSTVGRCTDFGRIISAEPLITKASGSRLL